LFYREALYYLDSVRRTARNLLFMGLILAWHEIIFRLAWCEDRCSAASSDKVRRRCCFCWCWCWCCGFQQQPA
jgi:hypothetical protein